MIPFSWKLSRTSWLSGLGYFSIYWIYRAVGKLQTVLRFFGLWGGVRNAGSCSQLICTDPPAPRPSPAVLPGQEAGVGSLLPFAPQPGFCLGSAAVSRTRSSRLRSSPGRGQRWAGSGRPGEDTNASSSSVLGGDGLIGSGYSEHRVVP